MRMVRIDGKPALIATQYYGNNETKSMLHEALKQLEEVQIFDNKVIKSTYSGGTEHKENANGYFDMVTVEDVHICDTIEDYVKVDCPMCDGSGNHEVYADRAERFVSITCPSCNGSGEIEASIYIDIDQYEEVEATTEIRPYNEMYTHQGGYITIDLDYDRIRNSRPAEIEEDLEKSFADLMEVGDLETDEELLEEDLELFEL